MMLTNLEAEALVRPSRIYGKEMQQYPDFFTSLFGNELMSFGYGRISRNGFYEGISNTPRVTEIFIETKTYQLIQFLNKQSFTIRHGFVYPNESADESIYNKFRIQLDKELDLYTTFYITESCLNYQGIFSWNFRSPLKSSSLTEWENRILRCFINDRKSIQYALDQFKVYYRSISKSIAPVKLFNPETEKEDSSSTRLGEKYLEKIWLSKNDLYLKDIAFTNKETLYIYFYLQGMSAKEIAEKMFVSRRTVEDYMGRIKQKLGVKSRSEFHTAMEKVNLWRNTL